MTWTNNLADMQLEGTFDLNDGNPVTIDALTGSGTVTTTNWTDSFSNSRTLTVGQNGGSGTFNGIITQATVHVTRLTKIGSGTQTLTGANHYSGVTTINGGTLEIGDGGTTGTLGSGAVTIASGATLTIHRSDNYGTGSNQVFSGAGTIIKEGTGDLIFNGGSDHTNVQGISNLVVNNGLVRTDYFGQWNSNLNLTANGNGILEMWNTNTPLATLSGNGTVQNTRFFDRPNTTLTVAAGSFSGTIMDSGGTASLSLVKTGPGTLTLSGMNSYTGTTIIAGGTLNAATFSDYGVMAASASAPRTVARETSASCSVAARCNTPVPPRNRPTAPSASAAPAEPPSTPQAAIPPPPSASPPPPRQTCSRPTATARSRSPAPTPATTPLPWPSPKRAPPRS